MKHLPVIAVVAVVVVLLALSQGCQTAPRWKTSVDFSACPNHHTNLRDVPILYGEIDSEGAEQDYGRFGYVCGGSPLSIHSPTSTVRCATCGFVYQQEHDAWARVAEDAASFAIPFPSILAEFLPFMNLTNSAQYEQEFRDGRQIYAAAYFYDIQHVDEAKAKILQFIAKKGLHGESRTDGRYYLLFTCGWEEMGLYINLWDCFGTDCLSVALSAKDRLAHITLRPR
ncbi:MAG: hypothetical protein JXR37_06270 [Kiritimatiellae bacterium]|nr:hypothetical protein [Kiritimatiellia bacterium]